MDIDLGLFGYRSDKGVMFFSSGPTLGFYIDLGLFGYRSFFFDIDPRVFGYRSGVFDIDVGLFWISI